MCYHSATPNKENLKKALGSRYKVNEFTSHNHANGFDHPDMPAVTTQHPFDIMLLSWGLIPPFIADLDAAKDIRKKTLNAKSETIFNLPSFKTSIKNSRCIIFVSGFYEWQHAGTLKIPHYISLPGQIMALGGVASEWVDKSTGEVHETCSIITTPANPLMCLIHNKGQRMPLILPPSVWQAWLDSDSRESELRAIMQTYPFSDLDAVRISSIAPPGTKGNNRNDIATLF